MTKMTLTMIFALTIAVGGPVYAAEQEKDKKAPAKSTDKPAPVVRVLPPWHIAVMTYTFNKFTLLEAIDKAKEAGAKYIETYAWQKIGDKYGEAQFNASAPAEALDAVKAKLSKTGIQLTGYYSNDLGKNDADTRKVFAFCKKMGIPEIIAEPDAATLESIDKLAAENKVKVAIHNHPKDPNKPEYTNWDPANVMKMLKGRSKWIGTCADNGHWVRSGLDPVECLKKYNGRLISMHLKDVDKAGPEGRDVPYGEGVVPLPKLLFELGTQAFGGVFSIEYESNLDSNLADVKKCIEYFEKAVKQAR